MKDIQTKKTILFALLIVTLILPFGVVQYADAVKISETDIEDFQSESQAKEFYKVLETEIRKIYSELKQSYEPTTIQEYQKLKEIGFALMEKYSPEENVTTYTEDEWFDYLATLQDNVSKTANIKHSYSTAPIYFISQSSGSVSAQIGYRAPCHWAPIFTCDTDVGSKKTVSTSEPNHVDFIGYTQEDNSWVTPYYKMAPNSLFKTYKGSTAFLVEESGGTTIEGLSTFNEYAWYPGIIFQKFVHTIGSSCSCDNISTNTRISMTINLLSVE